MEVFYPKCVSHHCKKGYRKKIELHARTYQGRIALLPRVRGHNDHRLLVPSYRSSIFISRRTLNRVHLGSQRAASLSTKSKRSFGNLKNGSGQLSCLGSSKASRWKPSTLGAVSHHCHDGNMKRKIALYVRTKVELAKLSGVVGHDDDLLTPFPSSVGSYQDTEDSMLNAPW